MRTKIGACAGLIFLVLTSARADDWPMYLGNLSHTSYASNQTQLNATNVPQLQQVWRTNVGAPIASGVTLSNNFLYFGAWDGNFYSMNAVSGAVAWHTFVGMAPSPSDSTCQQGIGVSSQPVVSGDTVYAGGGDSAVYALDINTGAVRWRVPLADSQGGAYLWSSVMLSNNALYIGIASLGDCPLVQGGLARIGLDDPTHPLFRYFVPDGRAGAGLWSTPAIDEQASLVYVDTGNASTQDPANGIYGSTLLALDATTLQIKATFLLPILPTEDDADWGSSPLLFQTPDGQQYVAASGKNGVMYVLHRPDLKLAWSYKLATDCDSPEQGCGSISTPAFDGQTIYAGAGSSDEAGGPIGQVYALNPMTHNPLWVYPARGIVLAPVTVTPALVVVPTTGGLAILNAATGAELWNDGGSTPMYGQAAVANGTIYSAYINGAIVAWGIPGGSGAPNTSVTTPTGLQFLYTSGGPAPPPQPVNVYTSAGPLSFQVRSDSAWLTTDRLSGSTPAVINVQANVSGLAPGSYSGTLTVTLADGSAPLVVQVSLLVNGPLPSLATADVSNAASYQTGILAPGSLFTIIATNLAGQTLTALNAPWPTALSGVSVTINGIPAPLDYVSPTQINAQVPFEVPPGPATLVVQSSGTSSANIPVTVAATAPGIFLINGTRAAAVNQDHTVNASDNPAPAGSIVSVYFTGQGQLDNPVGTGNSAPFQVLSNTLAPTTATIGGQPANVLFSGLAPRYIGLGQANLQIPNLPPGDYPVVLTVGGVPSNQAIVSVSAPAQ